ncbi:MAG: TetR/AcrR family transcriptional repressor of nem operon [Limisphaerales bacterium]|jgi:TetR/AcrR family transcriptional repressor of nem operon
MPRTKKFEIDIVLDRAIEVFNTNGFFGSSIAFLVDAMEINRASIYDTFGGKDGLFIECLNRYISLNQPDPGQGTAPERVKQVLETVLKQAFSNSGSLILKASQETAPLNEDIEALVKAHYSSLESTFGNVLQEGVAKQELHTSINPSILARYFTGIAIAIEAGAVADSGLGQSRKKAKEMIETALEILR